MSDLYRTGLAALAPEAQTAWIANHMDELTQENERLREVEEAAREVADWMAGSSYPALQRLEALLTHQHSDGPQARMKEAE